ncbi:hypothetical protein SBADM41S_12185 [Streptomyces badius]
MTAPPQPRSAWATRGKVFTPAALRLLAQGVDRTVRRSVLDADDDGVQDLVLGVDELHLHGVERGLVGGVGDPDTRAADLLGAAERQPGDRDVGDGVAPALHLVEAFRRLLPYAFGLGGHRGGEALLGARARGLAR